MSAFDDWKNNLPAGQGYSAEDAFSAGMTRAAEICESTPVFADMLMEARKKVIKDCAFCIRQARDGEWGKKWEPK